MTARNQETGLTRTDVSNDKGDYRLPALPPGIYKVTVELSGFNTESRPDILLTIDQTAVIPFSLKPATVAETVTVTGEAPIIDTNRVGRRHRGLDAADPGPARGLEAVD